MQTLLIAVVGMFNVAENNTPAETKSAHVTDQNVDICWQMTATHHVPDNLMLFVPNIRRSADHKPAAEFASGAFWPICFECSPYGRVARP